MSGLIPSRSPHDEEIATLDAHRAALESSLLAREADLDRVKAALAEFRVIYRQRVGRLHDELDELHGAIVAALAGLAENDPRRRTRRAPLPHPGSRDTAPRLTSDAVRKLFRDVAKAIHPDLAHEDEAARDRRHALMIAANHAYAAGDEERLRTILIEWRERPDAVPDSDPDAARQRLLARIAEIERLLASCDRQRAELQESPLWQLKVRVDEASARGNDLVGDMVRRLERDIMVARNRLDAIRHT